MMVRRQIRKRSRTSSASCRKSSRRRPKKHARSLKASRVRRQQLRPRQRRDRKSKHLIANRHKGAAYGRAFGFYSPAASMHWAVTRPVPPVFVLLENLGHIRVADWRTGRIEKKILFGHIGDVFSLRIFCEQMIEGLVLARTDLRRDCLPPLLGIAENRIDIEDHAPERIDAVFHHITDLKLGVSYHFAAHQNPL